MALQETMSSCDDNHLNIKQQEISTKIDNEMSGSIEDTNDDNLLIKMGYEPEFTRKFGYLSAFGQAWGSQALASSIVGSLIFALQAGGSVASVWTWIAGCILLIPVALALGEMSSSMPTSGSLYFWVAKLTPMKYRSVFSWFTAHMIILGYVMCYAAEVYVTATMFLATISMGTNGTYVPNKYHDYGVYVGFCIFTSALTCLPSTILAKLYDFFVFYHGALCFALILAMIIATPSEYRNSTDFVFTNFQNGGLWGNNAWAWFFGLLTPIWVVAGFESVATLAEEASNPAKIIPFSMIGSLLVTLFLGSAIIITLMFIMGKDVSYILESPFGQPVGQIIYDGLGRKGGTVLFFFLFLGYMFNCTNGMFAASRAVFAFARDNGLPFSDFLHRLNKWKTPVHSICACCFVCLIIGLLILINFTVVSSVFNIGIVSLYISYMSPVIARIVWRDLTPGTFYLGKFSIVNSVIAFLWMTFIIVLLLFPIYEKPNAEEMNYAVVVVGFAIILCLVYYYLPKYGGKHFFHGPVKHIEHKEDVPVQVISEKS